MEEQSYQDWNDDSRNQSDNNNSVKPDNDDIGENTEQTPVADAINQDQQNQNNDQIEPVSENSIDPDRDEVFDNEELDDDDEIENEQVIPDTPENDEDEDDEIENEQVIPDTPERDEDDDEDIHIDHTNGFDTEGDFTPGSSGRSREQFGTGHEPGANPGGGF